MFLKDKSLMRYVYTNCCTTQGNLHSLLRTRIVADIDNQLLRTV